MKRRKRETGGFALVELIVVIIILGALAGTGTVAYVGYVKKASKAVDEQLISQVVHSLYLAACADPGFLEGDAYVVALRYGTDPALAAVGAGQGSAAGEAKLTSALEDAFGAGCTTDGSLQLSYDGWTLGLLCYDGCSYAGNEPSLLTDLQAFATSLTDFYGANSGKQLGLVLNSQSSPYADYLKSMGVTTAQEAANGTVLYLGQYAAKSDPDEYASWWASGFDPAYIPSEISETAENYFSNPDETQAYDNMGDIMMLYAAKVAAAEAYYQYAAAQGTATEDLTQKLKAIQGAASLTGLMNAVTDFNAAAGNAANYETWLETQASNDAIAYLSCLNAIGMSADAFSGDLSNSSGNLYTDGKALSLVRACVSTAEAVTSAGLDGESKAVAITVCRDTSGNVLVTDAQSGETAASGSGGASQVSVSWTVVVDDGGFAGIAAPASCELNTGGSLRITGTLTSAGLPEGYSINDIADVLSEYQGAEPPFVMTPESGWTVVEWYYAVSGGSLTLQTEIQFTAAGEYSFEEGMGPNLTVTVTGNSW